MKYAVLGLVLIVTFIANPFVSIKKDLWDLLKLPGQIILYEDIINIYKAKHPRCSGVEITVDEQESHYNFYINCSRWEA